MEKVNIENISRSTRYSSTEAAVGVRARKTRNKQSGLKAAGGGSKGGGTTVAIGDAVLWSWSNPHTVRNTLT